MTTMKNHWRCVALLSALMYSIIALAEDTNAVDQAELLFRSAQYDKALPLFQQQLAAAADPESAARALFAIGQCLTATRYYDKAVAAFDNLLAKYPASTWADDALLRKGAVQARFLKNRGAGVVTWQELIRKYPMSDLLPDAYYYLGAVQWLAGQRNAARESFRALAHGYPKHPLSATAQKFLEP